MKLFPKAWIIWPRMSPPARGAWIEIIQASGANWARVSAGSGTLTGKTYIHNTRQVSKAVQEANTPNVKTVEDATLVSLANSTAVAQRLGRPPHGGRGLKSFSPFCR